MTGLSASSTPPIVILGAGGIVRDAHLPAYKKANFHVSAIYDLVPERAHALAQEFNIPYVFDTLEDTIQRSPSDSIFDIALPPSAFLSVLPFIPQGSPVLLQKPMGETLSEAREIRDLCNSRRLKAAVNFQLRFAPAIAKAREILTAGTIGDLHDLEVRVTVYTPWHLWTFLEDAPRVEIVHHSVHYIDLLRSFLGNPKGVYARTLKHPHSPKLASTRSAIILDYGDSLRATITTNHGHNFGPQEQESYVKWEGTCGAIKVQLGALMDNPKGRPDTFLIAKTLEDEGEQWQHLPLAGSWFPDAFVSSMQSLIDFSTGVSPVLPTSVDDAYKTMAVVEAAYESNDHGGTSVRY